MREIVLHGRLRDQFGESYVMHVVSPLEAIRGLCLQLDGFANELRKGVYRLVRGDLDTGLELDEATLPMNFGRAREFHIVPVVEGSKRGIGKVVVGVAIVGLATLGAAAAVGPAVSLSAGFSVAATSAFGGITFGQIALFGAALAVSGIASMLSPAPQTPGAETFEPVEQRPSALFNGAINAAEQGHPVPMIYGQFMASTVVISSGLSTEQIKSRDTSSSPASTPSQQVTPTTSQVIDDGPQDDGD